VRLLVSEKYIDSVMHGTTIKVTGLLRETRKKLRILNEILGIAFQLTLN
jgi:hypothetical protein